MTKPRCYQYAYKINKIVSLEFVTKKKSVDGPEEMALP